MRALVFGVMPEPQLVPETDNHLVRALATTPMRLEREHSDPRPLLSDWVVTKPLLTGICGSDSKQVFMDWGHETRSPDNPMKSFFSHFHRCWATKWCAKLSSLVPMRKGSNSEIAWCSALGCRAARVACRPCARRLR